MNSNEILITTTLLSTLSVATLFMFLQNTAKKRLFTIALLSLQVPIIATFFTLFEIFSHPFIASIFNHMLIIDTFSSIFTLLFTLGTLFTLLIARAYIMQSNFFTTESFSLMFFALFGMILLSMSNELLTAFISLEIASLAVYALIAQQRHNIKASEAFFKYLILGSFVGAFYLLGVMLIYAQTQTTHLPELAKYILSHELQQSYLIVVGGLFLMITVMFKMAVVPFGIWSLDVYDGAPYPITSFMAGVFKVAIFSIILRLFIVDYNFLIDIYDPLLITASVITMVVGSLLALTQNSIKRMLAASSIVHSGYIMIGLASTGILGTSAAPSILFYLIAYFLSAIGAFGVLSYIAQGKEDAITYESIKGLGHQHPYLALALSIFMLSLAGFPSTIGFLGKFYLFNAAIEANFTWLALLGALTAFVSIYYYFKVIMALYFYPPHTTKTIYGYGGSLATIFFLAILVLWGGVGTTLISFLIGPETITTLSFEAIESLTYVLK